MRAIAYEALERWVDRRRGPVLDAVVHCGYQVNHLLPLDSQMSGSVRNTAVVVRGAAAGRVDAWVDTFGDGYVDLAIGLGVAPDRIDTIIAWAAAGPHGTKTDGTLVGARPEVFSHNVAGQAGAGVAYLAHVAGFIAGGGWIHARYAVPFLPFLAAGAGIAALRLGRILPLRMSSRLDDETGPSTGGRAARRPPARGGRAPTTACRSSCPRAAPRRSRSSSTGAPRPGRHALAYSPVCSSIAPRPSSPVTAGGRRWRMASTQSCTCV